MTTCLTSPPKIRKTAFMYGDIADMEAPLAPCADRDDAVAAVVQDDLIDLAASTFRPTGIPCWPISNGRKRGLLNCKPRSSRNSATPSNVSTR